MSRYHFSVCLKQSFQEEIEFLCFGVSFLACDENPKISNRAKMKLIEFLSINSHVKFSLKVKASVISVNFQA